MNTYLQDFHVDGAPFITLTINATKPIELYDFVSSFTSLAAEYADFSRENSLSTNDEARLYIREIRAGSIVAEIIPVFGPAVVVAGAIAADINAIDDFVTVWGLA